VKRLGETADRQETDDFSLTAEPEGLTNRRGIESIQQRGIIPDGFRGPGQFCESVKHLAVPPTVFADRSDDHRSVGQTGLPEGVAQRGLAFGRMQQKKSSGLETIARERHMAGIENLGQRADRHEAILK